MSKSNMAAVRRQTRTHGAHVKEPKNGELLLDL